MSESQSLIILNGWDTPVCSPTVHESREALLGIIRLVNLAKTLETQAAADQARRHGL